MLESEATTAAKINDTELLRAALDAAAEKYAQLASLDPIRQGYWQGQQQACSTSVPSHATTQDVAK